MRGKIITAVILVALAARMAVGLRWLRNNYGGIR